MTPCRSVTWTTLLAASVLLAVSPGTAGALQFFPGVPGKGVIKFRKVEIKPL